MFQHPDNLQAMVDWKLETPRRQAEEHRLAAIANPRCRFERSPRAWTTWFSRPRRTRTAPKPTVA